ncbi:hypothetical protein CCP2SC5_740018 [Azospirillaceae bacterium]
MNSAITFTADELHWLLFNTCTLSTPAAWVEAVWDLERANPAAHNYKAVPLWMVPRLSGWEGYHIQLPPPGSPREWAILWTNAAWAASRTKWKNESYVELEHFKRTVRLQGLQRERINQIAALIAKHNAAVDVSPFLQPMLDVHRIGGEDGLAHLAHAFEKFAGGEEVFYLKPSQAELDLQSPQLTSTENKHEESITATSTSTGNDSRSDAILAVSLTEAILGGSKR